MLNAEDLRARAAEYRANAKKMADARTREQYLAVAKYLDDWAAQADAKDPPSATAPRDHQAV